MDGEPPGPQGRPRPSAVQRARRRVVAVVVAGAMIISLVLVIGVRAVVVRALCEQGPVQLHIAASLDIAPAVQRIGAYFNDLNRDVSGHCAQVEVTEDRPDTVAASLSGKATIEGEPPVDAWVPDSSLWVGVVRSSPLGAAAARPTGISVALSPLVIAAPRQVSHQVGGPSALASWKALFPASLGGPRDSHSLRVQLPNPAHSATGLASLVEARRLLGGTPQARDQFTTFVHNVVPTTAFDDPQALHFFATLAQPPWNSRPVTVTTEQAVEAYNQSDPQQPLAAFYLPDEYNLDYPFVLTTSSPLKVQAAAEFAQVLGSSFAAAYVRAAGFRSAGGQANQAGSQFGIVGNLQPAVALAGPGEAGAALQEWNRLNLGDRSLVLVDVSAAEALPLAPGAPTRLQVLSAAASLGLSLFPDSTQMGIWEYATHMNGALPYREMVPIGPLPAQLGLLSRRQQLQQIASTIQPRAGANAAIYTSILAAFRDMTARYQAGHVNALIMLGSGTDTDPADISLGRLLTSLRTDYDPERPVEIITVTAGTDGELAALQQITAITHGASYTVAQPSDIASVFFDAIARRICLPNCRVG